MKDMSGGIVNGSAAVRDAYTHSLGARFAADRDGADRALSGWLESWSSNAPSDVTAPWARAGRQYAGFSETFCRVLSWYKLHKISVFNSLGWHYEQSVVDGVASALRFLIAEALDDPALPPKKVSWLRQYDVLPLSQYTAVDQMFETVTGRPIRAVLDFGSGIGRQSFIWGGQRDDVTLASVDAIESLYFLQYDVYRLMFPGRCVEYFTAPADLSAAFDPGAVLHLPTWRLPILPNESFDLIVCVQVLQELNEQTLRFVLNEFRRLIKPGGLLYIRDNEFWIPAHRVRVGRELLRNGWHLAFRFPGNEGTDIEGIPRLWVFTGENYSRYFRLHVRLKRALLPSYSKSFRSWRDIGLPI